MQLTSEGLVSCPGFEKRPEGSLPVMRLEYDGDENKKKVIHIRESMAIMQYLDDLFPASSDHAELKGSTPLQRARATDLLSALNDAVSWGIVSLAHSNPSTSSWSGLKEEDMSSAAAAHAQRKVEGLMGKMDGWVRENMAIAEGKGKSVAGQGEDVTFADVALMAQVEYMKEVYGVDFFAGYGGLERWWEGMKGEEWVIGRRELLECERTGKWEGVLGK